MSAHAANSKNIIKALAAVYNLYAHNNAWITGELCVMVL